MTFRIILLLILLPFLARAELPPTAKSPPVYLGLDAEFGHKTSTSDDAVRLGIEIAIDDINRRGGVLGGRPLELVVTDNRSVPARGVDNFRALAARPDLVAIFGGKFSPVMLAQVPLAHELKTPLLAPWSAADAIIEHGVKPSYTFRLSVRDGWVMPFLFQAAERRGIASLGLLVPNGSWGRSNAEAAARHAEKGGKARLVKTQWYEWTDENLLDEYQALLDAGARAILFVGNEAEGARLTRAISALPRERRVPVFSHWGLSGGDFFSLAGSSLGEVDLSVMQSFSFSDPLNARAAALLAEALKRRGVAEPTRLLSQGGIAHAHDLTQLVALAIDKARGTDRAQVRAALESGVVYDGAVRRYAPAFTAERHEALTPQQMFIARWRADGALLRDSK